MPQLHPAQILALILAVAAVLSFGFAAMTVSQLPAKQVIAARTVR